MDENSFSRPKTYVQWMLSNSCNYNCSYCHEMFRAGDRSKINTDILIETCRDIVYHYDELGRDVVFEFQGGEPTLQDRIPEVGKRLSNFPTNIILKTNGSAPLEWWKKAKSSLGGVVISVHREFADVEHIEKVIDFLRNPEYGYPMENIEVLFPVTQRTESFDWGVQQVERFQKRFGIGNLQLLFSNFGKGSDMFLPYRGEQWEYFNKLNNYIPTADDLLRGFRRPKVSYIGQKCHAGIETLTIDSDGNVWRGWCRQGGILGNIHNPPVQWPTNTIICQKDFCNNGFDQQAKKEIV